MSNDYTWWRAALEGKFGHAEKLDPQPGYFRVMDDTTGEFVPAAIWPDEHGALLADQDGEDANPYTIWPKAWPNPVSYEAWQDVALHNKPWPITQNADAFTQLADTIAETIRAAEALAEADLITNIDARNQASDLAAKLVELRDEAEKTRVAEGAPHKDVLRTIDEKWKPVIASAKDRAAALKKRVGEALSEVKRRAAAMGIEAKTTAGTGARRAVGLRTRSETRCTDWAALWAHYQADNRLHTDPAVCRAIIALATADLNAGKDVPGAIIEQKEIAA